MYYATFEAQFMKNLNNTEAELKNSVFFLKKKHVAVFLNTHSFSYIISKKLFHISFKLNTVNFSRDFLPSSPLNPLRDLPCTQALAAFYSPIHEKRRTFFFPA